MAKPLISSTANAANQIASAAAPMASQAAQAVAQGAKAASQSGLLGNIGEGIRTAGALASNIYGMVKRPKQPDPFNPISSQISGPAPIIGGGHNPISPLQRNVYGGDRYQAISDLLQGGSL